MAMICIHGGAECSGCMHCQGEAQTVGQCSECKGLIYADEDYYRIEGETVHEDCLTAWARKYLICT